MTINFKTICGGLFAAIFLMALPLRAEQEMARLRYGELYQMQRVQAELSDTYTNLVVFLRMKPASTNLSPTNVIVYIDAKSGKIPVKIGPDGAFTVSMNNDLQTENPWLITDQPRGSMKLDWFMGLSVRKFGTVQSYRPLMQVVRDCADVRERMRAVFPGAPKAKVAGLKLIFSPPGTSATVTIHSQRGDHKLETDANGVLPMLLDPDLFEENPLVLISKEPSVVELISHDDDYGAYPTNYEEIVKKYFSQSLFDPYSAHFTIGAPYEGNSKKAIILGGGPETFGYLVDVGVNAKNRNGGYVGEVKYRLLLRDGYVVKQWQLTWPSE